MQKIWTNLLDADIDSWHYYKAFKTTGFSFWIASLKKVTYDMTTAFIIMYVWTALGKCDQVSTHSQVIHSLVRCVLTQKVLHMQGKQPKVSCNEYKLASKLIL